MGSHSDRRSLPTNVSIQQSTAVGLVKSSRVSVVLAPRIEVSEVDEGGFNAAHWEGHYDMRCVGLPDTTETMVFLITLLQGAIEHLEGNLND
jgi:hypothetical protein